MKKVFLDILNKSFPKDGEDNVALLLDYVSFGAHSVELWFDDFPCGFAYYETIAEAIDRSGYEKNNYMKNIAYNTMQVRNLMGKNDVYLSLIAVDTNCLGNGFGRELVRLVSKRNKGNGSIYLWADDTCNVGFWEKIGFANAREFDTPYGKHTVVYRKRILEI